MAYELRHKIWFPNRGTCGESLLGITPSSQYVYKEEEIKAYKGSMTLMSTALLHVSDQVTEKSATLVAMTGTDESYTDGKNIVIGTNPMNEHSDLYKAMDILMGLACHESCHCAYTDFDDYSLDKVMEYPIGKWLSNLYEDECIEEMLINKNKQWAFFLDSVLSHYFSYAKMMPQIKKATLSDTTINWAQVMLLAMVRQPQLQTWFPKDWLDTLGPMIDEIYEEVIVKINNPSFFAYSPTSTVNKATIATIEIMKKYISDDMLNKEVNQKMGMLGNSSSEASSNKQFGPSKSTKEREKAAKSARMKVANGTKNKVGKAQEKIAQENKNEDGPGTGSTIKSSGLLDGGNSIIGAAKSNDTDKKRYDMIKSRLSEEIAIAKKIIIPNDRKIEYEMDKFHRNGQLISSHIVQAIQGVNCVYQRKVVKRSDDKTNPKYALVLALDESRSMMSKSLIGNGETTTFEESTKVAITMYEAMKDFPNIDLYIYGHGDNIVKYVTPKEKSPYRLAARKIQYGQNEAISYDAIYRDVRLQTSKPILFFNITDCNYLACRENIVKIVEKMKKNNCIVSLMTILNSCYLDFNDKGIMSFNDELYGKDDWIHLDNNTSSKDPLKEGLRQLSKIFRKNLNKYRR